MEQIGRYLTVTRQVDVTGTNKLAGVEIDALVKWVSDGAVPHLLAPSQRATRQAGIAAMLAHSPRETRAG